MNSKNVFVIKLRSGILLMACSIFILASCVSPIKKSALNTESTPVKLVEEILIDSVWAANKVKFALRTIGDQQYVAYYDKNRMMTVATREIGSQQWDKKTLPNQLKWDSHNYVAMGIDEEGYIHVSGNMHVNPLVYFRSTQPYDIHSLVEVNKMVDVEEDDVTYPKFFYDKDEHLLFSYRAGTCGNGNILINQYQTENNSWIRYLNKPLFEGIEKDDDRAAYHRFVKDSEGNFHYIWMWRWTPEVATSHQICYATSPDLLNWKNAVGKAVNLPFRPDDKQLIVDPSPSEGGMHNGKYQIILTDKDEPIIGYLKYDEEGLTQLYIAKFDNGKWRRKKISDWNFRWKFFGGGDKMSKGASFSLNGFTEDGSLMIDWSTETNKSGVYVVNPQTLALINKKVAAIPKYPTAIHQRLTANSKMSVNLQADSGKPTESNTKFLLKWESMGKSHGRHAPKVIPKGPVSPLKLVEIQ